MPGPSSSSSTAATIPSRCRRTAELRRRRSTGPCRSGSSAAGGAASASTWRTPGAGAARPARRRGDRCRGDRASRAQPAAPLRCRLLAPPRARSRLAAALARPAARLSPARSARRHPRRPLRRRLLRRAVRAPRRCGPAARSAAPARPKRLGLALRRRPAQPRILTPGPKLAALTEGSTLERQVRRARSRLGHGRPPRDSAGPERMPSFPPAR
jgi:hypothetical protein